MSANANIELFLSHQPRTKAQEMIERITIENYKSIRAMSLDLRPVNVLIGANGAGKSNFISFFQLALAVHEGEIRTYSIKKGANNLLYQGIDHSDHLTGIVDFDNNNAYKFELRPRNEETLFVAECGDYWNQNNKSGKEYDRNWHWKAKDNPWRDQRDKYIEAYLSSFRVYHFHDTGDKSAMKRSGQIDDNSWLREDGSNLAAFLYLLQKKHPKHFHRIETTVRSIAPFFERFDLKPRELSEMEIRLTWKERGSDMYHDAHNLSDGTLRFMALTTLLLQPEPPKTIIIDEPELGLHPMAVHKLAGLIQKAAHHSQIIVSTQNVELVNQFEPEDIIAVDRKDGQSVFNRLDAERLQHWLEEFSLGELWQKNIIGGQP